MKIALLISDATLHAHVASVLGAAGHAVVSEAGDVVVTDDARRAGKLRAIDPVLPILVVTHGDDVLARVAALRAGADDALAAPFHASQMVARVDALGRRASLVPKPSDVVEADGCTLDLAALRATRGAHSEELSPLEVTLIRYLVRHRGRAVTRAELLEHVWRHSSSMETRTVDMTVARLRKKIERDASEPAVIVGVRGVGYRWMGTLR
jgi:DNA-binding response OmpR family regulator